VQQHGEKEVGRKAPPPKKKKINKEEKKAEGFPRGYRNVDENFLDAPTEASR
jgi:hypothetical protein